jgi:predicted metal-dependent phosphoesterase TrpH
VEPRFPEPLEILEAIHEAGGIAVLANAELFDNLELLSELIAAGLDGVEVWNPAYTDEQEEQLKGVAAKHNLLMTGGSNFHGMYSNGRISIGERVTTDEQINALMGYKAKQRRAKQKSTAVAAESS